MPALSSVFASSLDALRAEVRAIEAAGRGCAFESLPFGIAGMDERLVGNGLAVAALHELTAASSSLNDDAATT